MEYNTELDQANCEIYAEKGTDKPSEMRHKCVLCEKPCNINQSMSNQGRRLICNICSRLRFASLLDAFNWVNEG